MSPTNEDWQSLLSKVQRLESQLGRRRRGQLAVFMVIGSLLAASFFAASEILASSGPATEPAMQVSVHRTLRTENLQVVDGKGNVLIEFDSNQSMPRMQFRDSDGKTRAVLII